jgi:hypothetical protein
VIRELPKSAHKVTKLMPGKKRIATKVNQVKLMPKTVRESQNNAQKKSINCEITPKKLANH